VFFHDAFANYSGGFNSLVAGGQSCACVEGICLGSSLRKALSAVITVRLDRNCLIDDKYGSW